MRWRMGVLLPLALAAPAMAHDFWLQPRSFQSPGPAALPFSILIGHADFRQPWAPAPNRVAQFKSFGPDGAVDRRAEIRPIGPFAGLMRFTRPGTYVVAFQTTPIGSNLPAIRFNSYAELEGITPILAQRTRDRTIRTPGREIYSRRAKALVRIGGAQPAAASVVTRPLGLTLEIVPERDPYQLRPGERLPVRIFYRGRPLAGALVKLTNLDHDAKPVEQHRSDRAGRTSFAVPRTGKWLVNTIWSRPITGNPAADFDTTFSSLTFGYGVGS